MAGKPELLAPAGSPEALRFAVQSGADAVYLGAGAFNARRSAKNFSMEELAQAVEYCHFYGVRVYLTLNTLLTDRELPRALDCAREASALGVDAILIQDWGLFQLLRRALPDQPLHASTQMSLMTTGGARAAAEMGCERVVLAREMSGAEIAAVTKNAAVETEAFVHGALCMSYSGQCAMSALLGGRSGNRGTCAQPCRLPYRLEQGDGVGKNDHPLSLKDNCLAAHLEEFRRAGVACLKIEGRMKRPEYVAVVTEIYARLLREERGPTREEMAALEAAFSRSGFTDWYHQGKRGAGMFGVRPEKAQEPKELFAAARERCERGESRQVAVDFRCRLSANAPITLTASDRDGHSVTVAGPVPEPARSRSLTAEELENRLRKTGGTGFIAVTVTAEAEEGLALSAAAVNALRREALAALRAERVRPPRRTYIAPAPLPEPPAERTAPPLLTCSLMEPGQLTEDLITQAPARVYLPLERWSEFDIAPYRDKTAFFVTLPRIWRDGDEAELKALLRQTEAEGAAGVSLGNLGHFPLAAETSLSLAGDLGLNVFNARSLLFLHERGLTSAALSFELRREQIRDLRKYVPAEAVVYGRLPLQITENCLVKNAGLCRCDGTAQLRDRTGTAFPVLKVYGCRSEVENSRVLWLADRTDWQTIGLTYARLRFTTESGEACARVLRAYREGGQPPQSFTRGLFDKGVE